MRRGTSDAANLKIADTMNTSNALRAEESRYSTRGLMTLRNASLCSIGSGDTKSSPGALLGFDGTLLLQRDRLPRATPSEAVD